MYNIIIADDHAVFRTGLKDFLKDADCIKTIAEAADGQQVLDLIEANPNGYDLVVMDLSMPVMDGSAATKIIVEKHSHIKVVCLTMYDNKDIVLTLFTFGARGYVVKNADPQEIIDAIVTVMSGGVYYSNDISDYMFEALTEIRQTYRKNDVQLTEREKDILIMVCDEKSTTQIAEALNVSSKTIDAHRANIYFKTGAKGMVGLIKFALINGYYRPKLN